jgi:hypothetical protein
MGLWVSSIPPEQIKVKDGTDSIFHHFFYTRNDLRRTPPHTIGEIARSGREADHLQKTRVFSFAG